MMRHLVFAAQLALLLPALSACAGFVRPAAVELRPTTMNPGSEGKVTTAPEENGNTRVTVDVDHLPDPRALDPRLETYVVWVKPAGSDRYTNVGAVEIDDEQRGRLVTTTPHEDFFVVVTGETVATATRPSGFVVLQATVQQ